jgi:hypothetical protein
MEWAQVDELVPSTSPPLRRTQKNLGKLTPIAGEMIANGLEWVLTINRISCIVFGDHHITSSSGIRAPSGGTEPFCIKNPHIASILCHAQPVFRAEHSVCSADAQLVFLR